LSDKPSQLSLGRLSRRVSPKGIYPVFGELGLPLNVIERKEYENRQLVVLLLLLEWARISEDPTYQALANALYKEENIILNIEKVI